MKQDDIVLLLKASSIKVTKQRVGILQILSEADSPLTAENIYLTLSGREKGTANLSTVYRILDAFTQKDILIRTNLNLEGKATYELNHREHRHHIICIVCNEIIPIKGCPLGDYEIKIRKSTGYEIVGHNLEIRGVCPKCQKAKRE